ncbi:MAG: hypothetical protein HFH18_05435 [Ruminococcus sp.]|jgi:hypothetical protein|nr:hypothetical protein [Ruminococcus sp.]
MKIFENLVWGYCHWDTFALVFLAAITGWYFIQRHKLKKEIKDLEDQLD